MAGLSRRLIVVDRDGVINEDSAEYVKSPAEWRPLPGALEAIGRLTAAGFRVAVATNQSGIARGLFDEAALAAIHAKMTAAVVAAGGRLSGVYFCPHGPWDACDCRKPKPGLLLRAAADAGVAASDLVFIGDKASDVEAARAAGARPLLIAGGDIAPPGCENVQRADDLAEAAALLIAEEAGAQ